MVTINPLSPATAQTTAPTLMWRRGGKLSVTKLAFPGASSGGPIVRLYGTGLFVVSSLLTMELKPPSKALAIRLYRGHLTVEYSLRRSCEMAVEEYTALGTAESNCSGANNIESHCGQLEG